MTCVPVGESILFFSQAAVHSPFHRDCHSDVIIKDVVTEHKNVDGKIRSIHEF